MNASANVYELQLRFFRRRTPSVANDVHLLLRLTAFGAFEVRAHLLVRESLLVVVVLFGVVLQRLEARFRFREVGSLRRRAAAWAALKRGKRPARPNDDLPKQEL